MTTCELSVLIVTYRNATQVDRCLTALEQALIGLDAEVLLHDNASTDDTVAVARRHSGVDVTAGSKNLGFAAGCNSLVRRSRGRALLFLNPDTVISADAPRRLLEAIQRHPEAGLYGARTVTPEGRTLLSSAQGRMTLWSVFCFASGLSTAFPGRHVTDPESLGRWDRTTEREVPMLSGGALMVRRDAWERLGGFDDRYFMYGEDADLCERARAAGYSPRFIPSAVVEHEVGGSSAEGGKLVLLHRGKVTYLRKLWPAGHAALGVRLLLLGVALRSFAARVGAFPEQSGRSSGAAWQEAWARREEWRGGWPETTPGSGRRC